MKVLVEQCHVKPPRTRRFPIPQLDAGRTREPAERRYAVGVPAFNIQMSLADAVARWLHRHPEFQTPAPSVDQPANTPQTAQLVIELPPTLRNHPPPDELDQMQAIARKFDVAARAERNRALGRAGEERVLAHERAILTGVGRADLARRVRWVSDEDGDGAGYDIESHSPEGQPRLIEVKTTNGWERTPFHITRN